MGCRNNYSGLCPKPERRGYKDSHSPGSRSALELVHPMDQRVLDFRPPGTLELTAQGYS